MVFNSAFAKARTNQIISSISSLFFNIYGYNYPNINRLLNKSTLFNITFSNLEPPTKILYHEKNN
ncbi:hypothetical protein DDD_3130 [Nonlabens dokdonensis DSW-6]|uniref:Uncharacterized protein n=1 Tax=Nonlabens dokdonensis (strain DSM 17205 / KCTC 12402 / DSW-6) TaxID=592029 RepID=L7WDD1_NONDD|nr:hypothetical protein DDD_3130 [Nonlabens dokdonensis DSW-6]